MRRTITVTLATALLGGALVAGVPGASAAPAPVAKAPTINWGFACNNDALTKAHAECGRLTLPMDPAHPKTGTVTLAISRVKHTVAEDKYQGVMLVNPGGPGGSGLAMATYGSRVPNGVGNAYDWIGFDPRGVGQSTPSMNCLPGYFGYNRPDYRPVDTERVWLNRAKSYSRACAPYGTLLAHMKTTDWVADMEGIRTALGQDKINYFGYSYGTYLGQVYATLHPDRVRRMVLDSNVDPRKVWYQANLDQDVAFDRNINLWFAWLAARDGVFHLGTTQAAVSKRWYGELAKAKKSPFGGKIGPDEWTDIFLTLGYTRKYWPDYGTLFANWVAKHDPKPLIDEYAGNDTTSNENTFAVYNAVQCTDVQWPTDWNKWRTDNWRVYAKAPYQTWGNAWYNASCITWPAKAGTPVKVDGAKAPPILLIGETLDAATPFEGSLEVRSRFPKSALISGPGGTTHGASLRGDLCFDNQVAAYFADGTLPARKAGRKADTTCAFNPAPEPTAPQLQRAPVRSAAPDVVTLP